MGVLEVLHILSQGAEVKWFQSVFHFRALA